MKRLHLICNAHLDPLWMWDGDEGLASALATFRSAVQLAGEYDYIFCHNESLLYEWAERLPRRARRVCLRRQGARSMSCRSCATRHSFR